MSRTTGTPTWIDFGSTDFEASKAFYELLFGWEFEDLGPDMNHYCMIRKDGDVVGGGMNVLGMKCPEGQQIPSSWDVYLAVDDVDIRLRRALESGAHMLVEPCNAGASGRFSMVLDPTNAPVGLWQAQELEGYVFSGKPGTPVWFELMAQDFDAASQFYTSVFDFDLVAMPTGEGDDTRYSTNGPQATASSGLCDAKGFIPAEMGSFWRVYFSVEDCDVAVSTLQRLGGQLLDGPEDTPFGRIATVADPAGARFQLNGPVKQAQN